MATRNSTTARSNNNGRIPAVAYIRMSSDRQEASPQQQRDAIEAYAKQHGYRIAEWYTDEGVSGSRSDREGFQRLIADANGGGFKAVLCWDQDRLSRFHPLEANHYWYLLDTAGVHIATVAQGRLNFDDLGDWLKASVVQHGKAEYLKDLARNVKRGQRAAANRGEWMGGPTPRGYVVKNKRLAIGDPADVSLVRRIFDLLIGGLTPWAIAEQLNAKGVSTTRARFWSAGSVNQILKNEAYMGTYRRREIMVPDNHPAIVSAEIFSTARDKLENHRCPNRSPKRKNGYLLTGVIYCGDCGRRMQGREHGGCHTYVCSGYWRNRGACTRNTVFEDELLGHIAGVIQEKLLDQRNTDRLRKELYRQVKALGGKNNAVSLRKKHRALDAKLDKAKRRLVECDADMLPVVQERIRELQTQRECIQADLTAAETPKSRLFADCDKMVDKAMGGVVRLCDVLRNGNPEAVQKCVRASVKRIDLWTAQEKCGRKHYYHLEKGVIELFPSGTTSGHNCRFWPSWA